MTDTLPTQEQVDRVAKELAPDVVKIEMRRTRDHDGDRVLKFVAVLSDEIKSDLKALARGEQGQVHPVAERVRAKLRETFKLNELEDYYASITVRSLRPTDLRPEA
jgi:hypothetical protein